MKILIAKESGFCFGVKRAMDIALSHQEKGQKVSTFGELIHNSQVIQKLETSGIYAINSLSELPADAVDETLMIRSHGVGKWFYEQASMKKIHVIDGTCPYVKKIHTIVNEHSEKGYSIIIVGDSAHPEVQGISGWSSAQVYTADSTAEAQNIPHLDKACIVAQTTITQNKWDTVMEVLTHKVEDLIAFNTICSATQKRQIAADALSSEVDIMLVIGGKHSSNTLKLYEVCKKNCKKTYHIETSEELKMINLKNCDKIGITAGASTPDWIIKEIILELEKIEGEV